MHLSLNNATRALILTLNIALALLQFTSALSDLNTCNSYAENSTDLNWRLTTNLSTSTVTACITLNESNIVLDCEWNGINGTNSANTRVGVNITAANISVRNCFFNNFNYSSGVNSGKALLIGAPNATIYNIKVNNSVYGAYIDEVQGAGVNSTIRDFNFTNGAIESIAISGELNSIQISNSNFYNILVNNSAYALHLPSILEGISIYNNTFETITNAESTKAAVRIRGNHSRFYNNTIRNSQTNAIQIGDTTNSADYTNISVYNNSIYNTSMTGIFLVAPDNYNFSNSAIYNNFINQSKTGIIIQSANSTRVYNNIINNSISITQITTTAAMPFYPAAIVVVKAANVNFANNTIENSGTAMLVSGSDMLPSYDSSFTSYNDKITNSTFFDYMVITAFLQAGAPTINITNSSFRANSSGVNITYENDGSGAAARRISIFQLLNVTIFNSGGPMPIAAFNIYNSTQIQLSPSSTDAYGSALVNLTIYEMNSAGFINHTPHNFTAFNGTITNYNRTNIEYQNDYFQVNIGTPIWPQCATVFTPNSTFFLTSNESVTRISCFNVTAQNITIDCQGFYFNSTWTNTQYAVYTNSTNTTVKNCGFRDFISNSTSYAIYSTASNLTVYNSTFYNISGGIYSTALHANVTNNNFTISNNSVITLAANATITNNDIFNASIYSGSPFAIAVGNYSNIENNSMQFIRDIPDGVSIAINGSNVNVINNTINTNSSTLGIASVNNTQVNLTRNTIFNCNSICVQINSGSAFITSNYMNSTSSTYALTLNAFTNTRATVHSNTIITSGNGVGATALGILNSNNVTLFSNTLYGPSEVNTRTAISLTNSNITIYENNLTAPISIQLTSSSNLTITNSTFNTSAVSIAANNLLTFKVPINITTINSTLAILQSATINVSNNSQTLAYGESDSNGQFLANATTIIYNGSNTPNNHSETTVNASKANHHYNSTSLNLTTGQAMNFQTLVLILSENTPPTINQVNSPQNNSNLSAIQVINATILDSSPVHTVLFNVSNSSGLQLLLNATNQAQNYWNATLNTTLLQDGNYSITIYANDSIGNTNNTVHLQVTIDNTPPTTAFIRPSNNSNLSRLQAINSTASDSTLQLDSVQYVISNTSGAQLITSAARQSNSNYWNATLNTTTLQNGAYIITINANDTANNTNSTINITITIDNTLPNTVNATASASTTSAVITWNTNEIANASISYGTTDALGLTFENTSNSTNHSITINGLTASTVYYYNVTSCDLASNCNTSGPYTFTTTAAASSSSGSGGGNSPKNQSLFNQTLNALNKTIQANETFNKTNANSQVEKLKKLKEEKEKENLQRLNAIQTQQNSNNPLKQPPQTTPPFTTTILKISTAITLLALLTAITALTYSKYKRKAQQEKIEKLIANINETRQTQTLKTPANAENITTPIQPQIIQPQTTQTQPTSLTNQTSLNKLNKPSKIELYTKLEKIHLGPASKHETQTWQTEEDELTKLEIDNTLPNKNKLNLSQKAINKLKQVFKIK